MSIIEVGKINSYLDIRYNNDRIEAVLEKALQLKGLDCGEMTALLNLEDEISIQKLYKTAKEVKEKIYGKKTESFALIRISNFCNNNCIYCRFRCNNKDLERKILTPQEVLEQAQQIVQSGCKKILFTAGDDFETASLHHLKQIIETVHSNFDNTTLDLSIAPLDTEQCREVSNWDIGTYHISQESYHPAAYKRMHTQGPKSDYDKRLHAIDRAIEGGIKNFGLGILLGLYDWRFEVICLTEHAKYLSNKYGIEPTTVSIAKMESQDGSILSKTPPYQVLDEQFPKIIATLRLALPHTEIILPAKENPKIRKATLEFGVTTNINNIDISYSEMLSLQHDTMLEKV